MRYFLLLLPLLGSLSLTAGCDDDISSSSRLRRLRLLAVQAEPPNPAFGQTTVLRPLVYVPPGEGVTYEWTWCPVPTDSAAGYPCPFDQTDLDTLAARAGLVGVPPLFLGTGEAVAFTNPFPAALLAALCAGDSGALALFTEGAGGATPVYNCSLATVRMQVMLTIRGSTTDTGVLSLRLPTDETTPPNRNPVVAGVGVVERPLMLDEIGTVAVPRERKVKLLAAVEPAQAETYLDRQLGSDDDYVTDEHGQFVLAPTQERVTVFWFAEGGGFPERMTSWGPTDRDEHGQPLAFSAAVENPWTTPAVEDFARPASLVTVVVRDSRGGVAWTSGVASLEVAQ